MTAAGCPVARDELAELALGVLRVERRDALLEHVDRCPSCRAELASLVTASTSLWQAVRPVEPPAGFEETVLAAVGAEGSTGDRAVVQPPGAAPARRDRARQWRVARAAAVVAVVGAGVAGGWAIGRSGQDEFASEYASVLQELGGRALGARALLDANGAEVGHVFVYEGDPGWLFVQRHADDTGPLSVALGPRIVGEMTGESWGGVVNGVVADDVARVILVDPSGHTVARSSPTTTEH